MFNVEKKKKKKLEDIWHWGYIWNFKKASNRESIICWKFWSFYQLLGCLKEKFRIKLYEMLLIYGQL